MSEDFHTRKCLLLIQEQLNWGPAQNWANYDFEKLSAAIEAKTGVILSITTLKRIWGRIKYDHSPTLTTLNTLARFLDYEDWRSFTTSTEVEDKQVSLPEAPAINEENVIKQKKSFKIATPAVLGVALVLFAITFLIFSVKKDAIAHRAGNAQYTFKADKIISEGVPNSVVFSYDASAANSDSIYIVQTWDIRRKTKVSKDNHKHSAIYYYPGFFRTKLIVDSTVVKTHDLQITSNGWLCLVEDNPAPLYFKKQDCYKKDASGNYQVEVDRNTLSKYNLALLPAPPQVRFFNQRDLGDLMNDNFTFQTTLKNEFSDGTNSCQYVEVLIQCKDDIIIIPLAAKACAGGMFLYAAGKELNAKEADLSGFGADLNQWTTLRVETKDKKMNFFVNNMLAASFVFPNKPTGIVGLQYRFNGVGAVRDTWFENKSGRKMMD